MRLGQVARAAWRRRPAAAPTTQGGQRQRPSRQLPRLGTGWPAADAAAAGHPLTAVMCAERAVAPLASSSCSTCASSASLSLAAPTCVRGACELAQPRQPYNHVEVGDGLASSHSCRRRSGPPTDGLHARLDKAHAPRPRSLAHRLQPRVHQLRGHRGRNCGGAARGGGGARAGGSGRVIRAQAQQHRPPPQQQRSSRAHPLPQRGAALSSRPVGCTRQLSKGRQPPAAHSPARCRRC
jgi:hypothetical protein